jgi:endo-1,4-beta-xylanase
MTYFKIVMLRFFHKLLIKPAKKTWIIGLVIIILGGLLLFIHSALASNRFQSPSGTAINLIDGQDWGHLAGASQTNGKVHISPLGRAIVNQDGSGGQPNPPVNVRGPHLQVSGDFKIDITATNIPRSGPASFTFYSQVPIIYDEWRYQPAQVELDLYQDKLTVLAWRGKSDKASEQKTWPISKSSQSNITLATDHGKIIFLINGQSVGSLSSKNLFKSGQVWFGADAPMGSSGWELSALISQSLGKGSLNIQSGVKLTTPVNDNQSLKKLAALSSRDLPIGAAVSNYALFSDSGYRDIVANQFSMITPENELKAQFIHPQPNTYSFAEADSLVDFALANSMSVHGHNLTFSEANPKWMQTAPLDQRQAILTSHIQTVVSHFGTKINEWDVVDEPLNDNDDNNGNSSDLRQNIWFAAVGENYIDSAFKAAHAANPKATLYLNEYGLEANGPRWDEFISLVKRLQARGVPINGVGFQAHVYEPGDDIDQVTLENHIKMLATMGLKSRISELDVYGDNPQHQADQYSAVLNACLDQPTCTSLNIWGVTDKYGSTTDTHTYPLSLGDDLLWDSHLKPKLAYNTFQKALQ